MAQDVSIHIGLNRVDPGVYGDPLTLRGCENDARAMQRIAARAGFDGSRSTVLLSERATAATVTGAIRDAARTLDPGGILFLTYSGHGSQIPDPGEPDGLNETWVLYDRQLVDDELGALWERFADGCRILVLSDSCHSGSVIKDLAGELVDATLQGTLQALPLLARSMPGLENARPRARAMPYRNQVADYLAHRAFYDAVPRLRDIATGASVLLISGCADNQVSLDGDVNGLFTEKLLEVWQEGVFDGDHERLHTEISRLLPFTQSPQLSQAGEYSTAFVRQRPLTVAAPSATGSPTPAQTPAQNGSAGSWSDRLHEWLDTWEDPTMTVNRSTDPQGGSQEKWIELLPMAINIGMQLVDAFTKEGYRIQDPAGRSVATSDPGQRQKWLEFIPLAISLGAEIYDALSKSGNLPAERRRALPAEVSPDTAKDWLDLIPTLIQLGSGIYDELTRDGFVTGGSAPSLKDPAAKGWLDLIPIALEAGLQVLDELTRSGRRELPGRVRSADAQRVRTFGETVLAEVGGR
ncbi:hypothetical protein GCM10009613_57350 [Pseudonocardia kongjuensis]|uniref:Peptidase C14 caspase domain-containing protein n=1 Tax=Pseudonocardia kongjuensis TaxID=102227 RepID=A0ABN1Y820_9PSEU